MSFVDKIKSLLPVSSRSFHEFERYVNSELHDIKKLSIADDPRADFRFWSLFQREGESLMDAKRRFFSLLPKATGGMRLVQQAQTKLLGEFHAICEKLEIHYFATGGTLIGAERHHGFIPWDDDLDVAITRDDLNVLKAALEQSTTHRVMTVWDYRGACEQIRFRTMDSDNPAFIDLFIFDWTSQPTVEMYRRSQEYRRRLVTELHERFSSSEWPTIWMLDDNHPLASKIREVFEKYRLHESEEDYASDSVNARGIYRSIENFYDPTNFPYVGDMNDWFPAREMEFEGIKIWAPNNKDKFLDGPYGTIWELPDDINSHFQHISRDTMEDQRTQLAIKAYLEN